MTRGRQTISRTLPLRFASYDANCAGVIQRKEEDLNVKKQRQRNSSAPPTGVGPFSVVSPEDGTSLTLGRRLASGEARSQTFADEQKAGARASKLGQGWEPWSKPGSPGWFVRRLPRNAYDPSKADATYTVLGSADEVMARFVTADAVPALMRRARGEASVLDDRDGNLVIAGTDGVGATLDRVVDRLGNYEAEHVVAPGVVGYFTDSANPGRALTLGQLNYDPAKNDLDPRDEHAMESLAPGESHQPLPDASDDGPLWGLVTRLSAATQPKAFMRGGIVLGMGLDETQARADATERSPTDAEAADAEMVDGTLAALSGWHDDDLRDLVGLAPDGTVRRIDVYDVLPHDQGTPNDPGWASDEWDEPGDAAVEPAPEPTYWLLQTIDGKGTRERVGDLDAGRAAWLAAVNGGRATYAALTGPGNGRLNTWPCEWSTGARTFHDRTDAHRAEMAALAARLTADASEGYSITLRDQPRGWRVVFTGSRFGEHTLDGSASTAERVQSHWCGYTSRSEGV